MAEVALREPIMVIFFILGVGDGVIGPREMLLSDADLGLALDCFWCQILLTCCKVQGARLDGYLGTAMTLSDTRGGGQIFRMQLGIFRETNITIRTSLSTGIDAWVMV